MGPQSTTTLPFRHLRTGRWCTCLTLLATLALTSACGVLPARTEKPNIRSARELALQRWHDCTDRHLGREGLARLSGHSLCEGYRRDLIALYPAHMANRIDKLLSENLDNRLAAQLRQTGRNASLQATEDSFFKARDNDL